MDLTVPVGLALFLFGLPHVYVGWSKYRERGVPRIFVNNPALRVFYTLEGLPRPFRSPEWFEGGMQVIVGVGFSLSGVVMVIGGFVNAIR